MGAGVNTSYSYGVEGRLIAVREGGRLLMAATYDGDGNRATQSSLYHAERQLNADASGLGSLPAFDLDSRLNEGSVIHAGISAFTYGFFAMATAFGSSICAPVMPWALDAIMSALASSAHGAEGLPAGIPGLVMDNKAILEDERNAIASAIGLIPRGLSTTEETFDVVSYVNSTLSSATQVMTSSSSRSGNINETYGIGRLASTSSSATSFFLNDGRGSVVQTTNAQGDATSWKSYSAFGQIESSSDLGELPSYGYNAEEQHPTTGLTYLRFRYYEASTSTFGVQDTYLGNIFSPLTLNRYLYCLSNPVNYVDPTGHVSLSGIWNGVKNVASSAIKKVSGFLSNVGKTLTSAARKASKIIEKGIAKAKMGISLLMLKAGMTVNSFINKAKAMREAFERIYCETADIIEKYQEHAIKIVKKDRDDPLKMINDFINLGNSITKRGEADNIINAAIGATRGKDGAYHIRQDWWQSINIVGYNDFYDFVFTNASGAFGGGASRQKYEFFHNGEKITLWAWKGDYLNLGADAELGIYKGDYFGHTLTAPEYSMPMTLKVTNKVTGQTYVDYKPTENQWWVTGFNPSGHNVSYKDIESTTTIDFSSNPEMYEAFRKKYEGDDSEWEFDPENKKATLTW